MLRESDSQILVFFVDLAFFFKEWVSRPRPPVATYSPNIFYAYMVVKTFLSSGGTGMNHFIVS